MKLKDYPSSIRRITKDVNHTFDFSTAILARATLARAILARDIKN